MADSDVSTALMNAMKNRMKKRKEKDDQSQYQPSTFSTDAINRRLSKSGGTYSYSGT